MPSMLPSDTTPQEVREQLARLLRSRGFAQSPRMARFLRYTVEEALAGRGDTLKEYLLGMEVFDRRSSYDPRVDPIVRVEARRLRAKLRHYYETEGRADALRIEYPTGKYIPRFATAGRSEAPPAAAGGKTVAVLPFANLSAQPDTDYFSDGLTAELIHALTRVDGLRVVAWSSAAEWKGRAYDREEVARRLDADAVLEGSVRREGGRVRIAVRLVDARAGVYLWSETYDRDTVAIFAIQEEIARAIAAALEGKLVSPAPAARPNLEVYNLYLKGRYQWNKRTEASLRESIAFFEQAITRDPGYAPGHAGLADAWSLLVDFGHLHPREGMPRAKSAALRALELDATLAEAHTSLGFIRSLYDWEWKEAEAHYLRALELNPSYATAHHWYAVDYLANVDRIAEAFDHMRQARKLDPLSAALQSGEGLLLMLSRRYEEALEYLLRLSERLPDYHRVHTALGRVYGFLGRYEEACASLHRGIELAGELPNAYGALGQIYALAGREEDARRQLAKLEEIGARRSAPPTAFAFIHTGLGEYGRALDCLEEAAARRELPLSGLRVHPGYDALRGHARFQALLERVGLASV